MADTNSNEPNLSDALKVEDWAGETGLRWLANLNGFESTIAPIGEAFLARAAYQPGERVLDIGFGGGATSIVIAHAVSPSGEVVGVDVSPDLVKATTHRAKQEGLSHARFICADAGSVAIDAEPFDRLCSRFGSMFFPEPVKAFANLRSLLKPGGRIDLAVWAAPAANPWMFEPMKVVRRHVDMPPPVPRAPGPFAFEDLDYLHEVLRQAGFAQAAVKPTEGELSVGGNGTTPSQAMQFAMQALSFSKLLLDYPQAVQDVAANELTKIFAHHYQPERGVMMGYKVWLVSAFA